MTQFIDPADVMFSAGTWTDTQATNVWSKNRTAADAAFNIKIPIKLLQNSAALKGSKLVSIDIWWVVATAALDSLTAAIYKATLPANGAAHAAPATPAFSFDTGHDTGPERLTLDEHKMTLTITDPAFMDDDDVWFVELQADAAATSVFKFHGARANFTLRV
jgi:hypothetical protein